MFKGGAMKPFNIKNFTDFMHVYLKKEIHNIKIISENISGLVVFLEDQDNCKMVVKIVNTDSLCQLYGFNKDELIQFLTIHTSIVDNLSHLVPAPRCIPMEGSLLQVHQDLIFYCMEFCPGVCNEADAIHLAEKLLIAEYLAILHQKDISMYEPSFWDLKMRFLVGAWQHFIASNAQSLLIACSNEFVPDASITHFINQVCSAVTAEAIMAQGQKGVLAHTDIKPKNVLWNKDNQPIILDWEDICLLKPEIDFIDTITSWAVEKTPEGYFFKEDEAKKFRQAYGLKLSLSEMDIFISAAKWMFWIMTCAQLNRKKELGDGLMMLQLLDKNRETLLSL